MSSEQKPGDPADKAADGAFGGVQSHRAGYGDDKLARLTDWLRAHPTATLASGEGALLLAENDRLRDDLQKQADWADWAKGEIDRLRVRCRQIEDDVRHCEWQIERLKAAVKDSANYYADACIDIDRLTRILAALREPSEAVVDAALTNLYPGIDRSTRRMYLTPFLCNTPREAIRAAVAAAEQEVGRE